MALLAVVVAAAAYSRTSVSQYQQPTTALLLRSLYVAYVVSNVFCSGSVKLEMSSSQSIVILVLVGDSASLECVQSVPTSFKDYSL